MNKFLAAIALLLAALYAVYFTDWFKRENIRIMSKSFPDPRNKDTNSVEPINFYIVPKTKVKSIGVIAADDATNRAPHYLWRMVAVSNAVAVDDFPYGAGIKGMRPFIPSQDPEPLRPRTHYRLRIETDKVKAEKDFVPRSGG
jgi:hypothetical protein